MEKIIQIILTTDIIIQAENVSQNTAQRRLNDLKGVCGKANPTIFEYFKSNGFTVQDVCFSFGQPYAQRYLEANRLEGM